MGAHARFALSSLTTTANPGFDEIDPAAFGSDLQAEAPDVSIPDYFVPEHYQHSFIG